MLGIVNVAIGAMLGIVLADSPAFKVAHFSDLSLTCFFVILVTLQSANVWAASNAVARQAYGFALGAIAPFLVMQVVVFCIFVWIGLT